MSGTSKKRRTNVVMSQNGSDKEQPPEEEDKIDEDNTDEDTPKLTTRERCKDIDAFFDAPSQVPGNTKKKRQCMICKCVLFL